MKCDNYSSFPPAKQNRKATINARVEPMYDATSEAKKLLAILVNLYFYSPST